MEGTKVNSVIAPHCRCCLPYRWNRRKLFQFDVIAELRIREHDQMNIRNNDRLFARLIRILHHRLIILRVVIIYYYYYYDDDYCFYDDDCLFRNRSVQPFICNQ